MIIKIIKFGERLSMGRPSKFEDEEMPELPDPDADISEKERKRIYNRRHYLRHKRKLKLAAKLYYRCRNQKCLEDKRKRDWKNSKRKTLKPEGPLEQGDPEAIKMDEEGQAVYEELREKLYKKFEEKETGE